MLQIMGVGNMCSTIDMLNTEIEKLTKRLEQAENEISYAYAVVDAFKEKLKKAEKVIDLVEFSIEQGSLFCETCENELEDNNISKIVEEYRK